MNTPAVTSADSGTSLDGLVVRHRLLDDRTGVVTVQGELDLATAPTLKAKLAQLFAQGCRDFVLDLSQVGHMDSTGLGVLIGLQVRLGREGVVAIAGAPHNVIVLFEVTRLDGRFPVFSTVDDALAHIRGIETDLRRPPLSPDAAMVVGLASTALPFADSSVGEAERWLRILRRHGNAGRALRAAGISDTPVSHLDSGATEANGASGANGEDVRAGKPDDRETIASVVEHASRAAAGRGAKAVGTADVLTGVMAVYGVEFDRVLCAYGSGQDAVQATIGALEPADV
jgi:anti-sigma B factor antagonist